MSAKLAIPLNCKLGSQQNENRRGHACKRLLGGCALFSAHGREMAVKPWARAEMAAKLREYP